MSEWRVEWRRKRRGKVSEGKVIEERDEEQKKSEKEGV